MATPVSNFPSIVRFRAESINCFTGGLVQLLRRHGVAAREPQLLELADGYLCHAGFDEWGDPEYRFDVPSVGLRGCARLGAGMMAVDLGGADWLDALRSLAQERRGAVIWVNTHRLTYDTFYSDNPAYMHALLVTEVDVDQGRVRVHDPLVVDRERYACEAWMTTEDLRLAITDGASFYWAELMGIAHAVGSLDPVPTETRPVETLRALAGQAQRRRAVPAHRDAVANYCSACMDRFTADDGRVGAAARRLFDHIYVLYILPGLELLRYSLCAAAASPPTLKGLDALVGHWRALGLLALKFEAMGSPKVLERIQERFASVSAAEDAMWSSLEADAVLAEAGGPL
jgi:hypothetical protein